VEVLIVYLLEIAIKSSLNFYIKNKNLLTNCCLEYRIALSKLLAGSERFPVAFKKKKKVSQDGKILIFI